jgi:hypothetical protein
MRRSVAGVLGLGLLIPRDVALEQPLPVTVQVTICYNEDNVPFAMIAPEQQHLVDITFEYTGITEEDSTEQFKQRAKLYGLTFDPEGDYALDQVLGAYLERKKLQDWTIKDATYSDYRGGQRTVDVGSMLCRVVKREEYLERNYAYCKERTPDWLYDRLTALCMVDDWTIKKCPQWRNLPNWRPPEDNTIDFGVTYMDLGEAKARHKEKKKEKEERKRMRQAWDYEATEGHAGCVNAFDQWKKGMLDIPIDVWCEDPLNTHDCRQDYYDKTYELSRINGFDWCDTDKEFDLTLLPANPPSRVY